MPSPQPPWSPVSGPGACCFSLPGSRRGGCGPFPGAALREAPCRPWTSALNSLEGAIDGLRKALAARKNLLEAMAPLRKAVDLLEGIVDDDLWPMPKYREMLFIC